MQPRLQFLNYAVSELFIFLLNRTLPDHSDAPAHALKFANLSLVSAPIGENLFLIDVESITIELQIDPILQVKVFKGSDNPIYGWISRGYHQKNPCTTIVGSCCCLGNTTLICKVNISASRKDTNSKRLDK